MFGKVLAEVYKTHHRSEAFLKTPSRPATLPVIDPSDVPFKRYSTENHWIWFIYEDIKQNLERAIEPLKEYLSKFDKYKGILSLNPVEYAEKMETEKKEINEIKEEIMEMQMKEKMLREAVPDSIQVSLFQVIK